MRLYLINSPVVRAEPLRFRKEGVLGVVSNLGRCSAYLSRDPIHCLSELFWSLYGGDH